MTTDPQMDIAEVRNTRTKSGVHVTKIIYNMSGGKAYSYMFNMNGKARVHMWVSAERGITMTMRYDYNALGGAVYLYPQTFTGAARAAFRYIRTMG